MNSATLQNKKLELIQWLSTIEDSKLIEKIAELRKSQNIDWWNSISDDEKISIDKGLRDAEAGKLNSHQTARGLYDKWL